MANLVDPPGGEGVLARNQLRVLRVARLGGGLLPANRLGTAGARLAVSAGLRRVSPARRGVATSVRVGFDNRRVIGEWVCHPAARRERVLYYLHGSGYFACSPRTHRGLVTRLSKVCDRRAFTLRYRMAPEYRFPAAQDDALAGYRWLLAQGYDAGDIVVGGDSAGGHLALGLIGELHRRDLPQPAGVFAFSPLVDPTFAVAMETEDLRRDPLVRAKDAARLVGGYMRGADPQDPRFDVTLGAGSHLPPILLQAGGREVLAADAEHFAAAQEAAGGSCEVQLWRDQVHVFQIFPSPAAKAALGEVERFVAALDG